MHKIIDPDHALKRQRLFEELRQAHAQAEAAAAAGAPSLTDQSPFLVESRKAAEIVARIRALDSLQPSAGTEDQA